MENTQQQLDLITGMIQAAQKKFNENGAIYMLWGWTVAVASLVQYISLKTHFVYGLYVWVVLVPLALIAQFVIMARRKKQERVRTHIDRIVGFLWMAIGISLGVTFSSAGFLQQYTYPVIMVLYAIGTFVSGGALQFRPLIVGAICCWVIALISFYVGIETQSLLLSIAVILSFLVPGYMLKLRQTKHV